jgi:Ca2+-binding RTX toxin-like protein
VGRVRHASVRDRRRPDLPRLLVPALALTAVLVFAVPLASAVAPVANPDAESTQEDAGVDIDVLENDTPGAPEDTLSVATFTQPTNGVVTKNLDETLRYVPNANFNGEDEFTYTAQNQVPEPSGQATVTVTVTAVNDGPVAGDDTLTVAEDASATAVPDLLLDDSPGPADESAQTLTVTAASDPANGSTSVSATAVQYTPDSNYFGPDSFTYTVCDDSPTNLSCDSATVSVTVTPVNDAPDAVDDAVTITAAGATFDVRSNDSKGPANESAQTLTPSIVTPPASGTTTVNPNGTITYTPGETTAGNLSLVYQVCDDGAPSLCDQATVAIEALPRLAISDSTVIEGDSGATQATFQASLNAAFTKQVTVGYATASGSAMSGADFQAASGSLAFAPGELVKSVVVNVVGDQGVEPDETFFVDLSSPVNATISDGRGAATIRNDDTGGCDLTGTRGSDRLVGTAASETICGLGGNDTIDGGGGDDLISGGAGNDRIDGGAGSDTITGDAGNDRIEGGTGDDAIDGDAGNDRISGDAGGDAIEGGGGNDTVLGLADSDTIDGGAGNDVVRGGGGADTIDGHGGNDRLFGDGDDDRLDGGAGSDRVLGDAGNDWVDGGPGHDGGRPGPAGAGVFGGSGNDTLRGEGGNDVFTGGSGNDTVLGGGGVDLVLYSSARGGVSVDLTRGRATGDGRDRVLAVEDVEGSRFGDTLVGSSAANTLAGGAGNDRLEGRGGPDTLLGGPGNDRLRGEGGFDTLVGGSGGDRCDVGPRGGRTRSC